MAEREVPQRKNGDPLMKEQDQNVSADQPESAARKTTVDLVAAQARAIEAMRESVAVLASMGSLDG
jgi:hypothetical protein